MAERSKAPDSRLQYTFSLINESGRSGLRMEAWVRIPLLTSFFFFFFFVSKLCVLFIELLYKRCRPFLSKIGFGNCNSELVERNN